MVKLNKKFLEDHSIKAAIFDMDGLLIDSETELWPKAEKETFRKAGVELTDIMHHETMGFRVDEIVNHWYAKFPWNNMVKAEVAEELINRLIELIKEKGEPLPGVTETIEFFATEEIPIAVGSSSYTRIIDAVLDRIGIRQHFSVIHSAEFEEYGKPHPAVFITTANKLGIDPRNCLVFEDSVNGIIAAKSAKMKCVAVPSKENRGNPKIAIADFIVNSLEELH